MARRGCCASRSGNPRPSATNRCGGGSWTSTAWRWRCTRGCSTDSRQSSPPSRRSGLRWGIVTNKPGWLAAPLLAEVGLAERCACLVAGDTLAERKPHPLPLLHAAALLGLEPRECAYVGDAERDVQAARNAGMIPLVAGFGYLGDGDDPAAWRADAVFARPEDLVDWLGLGR